MELKIQPVIKKISILGRTEGTSFQENTRPNTITLEKLPAFKSESVSICSQNVTDD